MEIVVRLHPLFAQDVGMELVERLAAICPEGMRRSHFKLGDKPVSDPTLIAVLEELRLRGFTPWPGRRRRRRDSEYNIMYLRRYDQADLSACDYLWLTPESQFDASVSEHGVLRLDFPSPGLERSATIAGTTETRVAISDRAKRLVEASELLHVRLEPAECFGERDDYPGKVVPWTEFDESDAWWELVAEMDMPPVAPSMVICASHTGELVAPGYEGDCGLRDADLPECPIAELHYRAADIKAMEPFDLARGFEVPRFRYVVSRRFYEFWTTNELGHVGWVPVRIDE